MNFKSRKDPLFFSILLVLITLFVLIGVFSDSGSATGWYWYLLGITPTSLLFIWFYFGTSYSLSASLLKYKSGPLTGSIPLKDIREIIRDKTLWVGRKPATARKGLIIKYNLYDEIYISPQNNDDFIKTILSLNADIKII
ncbi:PH domain-containing protein [Leeuwenhoekiella palythoae]|uniref:PH (Pleckstrin Homology) domain-containing protein n=1 Tax=Leeuwenhoekiella palythoae TaxID=573501 RepID=A0A1M5XLA6_9FLAO|nr:PH domain-containing protein [Leeuwenhoekiella palythoae]MBH12659.1 hypothetical protein [Leeuwenhoekiella sp.]RXG30116.1 PH (Pleckstrin Homology) domain-containing protein [Leeuwenhoekiella palythoae]UBZ10260.1 PH domain-containing protein [Leeuwenhoekiella palythoae]SHI00529.1 PH domain-containing protein [Leeuwenhoekiella palythoae]|tara:strand:+ start:8543 stop:8962 length:420 start_codon:yes stop_codon:yes gene_type:complete